MSGFVLDASALLAVILAEPGKDVVQRRMPGALMSTVNGSEAMARGIAKGIPPDLVLALIATQEIRLVSFDADQALDCAKLRPATKSHGLSFADRACLTLALREEATAVTADRIWATLEIGCKVELIR